MSRATDPGLLSRATRPRTQIVPILSWVPGLTPLARDASHSRRHHHLADDLAILDQPQALARLLERQHLVDHRLHLALLDQIHQTLQVLVIEAVRADDLELEAPD